MSETKVHPSPTGKSLLKLLPLTFLLAACGPNYSPNTYSSSAVQQASKVDSGIVVGVRKVAISVDSTLASTTGAAAGGIAGSQMAEGAVSALGALGGAVVGGLAGNEVGHKVQDTFGYEYIVKKSNGDLLSVTQKDMVPLTVGQRVLLIQGSQARIVSDYTVPVETDLAAPPNKPQSPNEPKPDLSKAAAEAKAHPAPPETNPEANKEPSSPEAGDHAAPAEAPAAGTAATPSAVEASSPAATSATPGTAPAADAKAPATAPAASASTPAASTPAATPASATPAPQSGTQPSSGSAPAAATAPTTTSKPADTNSSEDNTSATSAPVTQGPGSAH